VRRREWARFCAACWITLLVGAAESGAHAQPIETLGEVRVHGNHTTPDADVLALAGLTIGAPVTDESLGAATDKLRASGRFANVELRKRYRSIDNPTDILIVVLIDEHAAVSEIDLTPGPLKRIGSLGMWLPIIDYADGYGFTYGARVSFVDTLGSRSRISVPLTWGGERRAAVEADRQFERGPFSRIEGAASVLRRENPHFERVETRQQVRVRAERALTPWLRVGGGARLTDVRFGGIRERHLAPGVDVLIDTRTDPAFPRNAVHVIASLDQLRFRAGRRVARTSTDVRGYVGLFRSAVLAVRAVSMHASDPLPEYEQALLGGAATLRGYRFGYRAGDNLAALSAEVRVPITSPLSVGRFGVKTFIDAGTVYAAGSRLGDQRFDRGVGGGVFVTATVFRAGLDVAWPQSGNGKPRWHFGLGVTF
jgi:outer membrane protein assembly factor BamA